MRIMRSWHICMRLPARCARLRCAAMGEKKFDVAVNKWPRCNTFVMGDGYATWDLRDEKF